MNAGILSFVLAVSFSILLGLVFLKCLRLAFSWVVRISMALFLGLGLISLWMLLLLIMKISLTLSMIIVPLSFLAVLCLVVMMCVYPRNGDFEKTANINSIDLSPPLLQKLMLGGALVFIGLQIIFIFKSALLVPVSTWDGIYSIVVKSKYLFYGGDLAGLKNFLITSSYPIQMELDLTWIALVSGQWDDQWIKLIFPTMLLAYLPVQYEFIRTYTDRRGGLLSCALMLCSYFMVYQATIEYRSIFFLIYNILPLFLILRYFQRKDIASLVLAGFFAGMAAFIKLEGSGHLLIYLLLICFMLGKQRELQWKKYVGVSGCFLIPALIVSLPFWWVKQVYNLGSFEGRLNIQLTNIGERIVPIISKLFDNLFLSGNWSILWFVLLVFIVTARRETFKSSVIQYFGLALFLYFSLYASLGLLTSTYNPLFEYSNLNLSRAILHFFPLCPILIVLLINSNNSKI